MSLDSCMRRYGDTFQHWDVWDVSANGVSRNVGAPFSNDVPFRGAATVYDYYLTSPSIRAFGASVKRSVNINATCFQLFKSGDGLCGRGFSVPPFETDGGTGILNAGQHIHVRVRCRGDPALEVLYNLCSAPCMRLAAIDDAAPGGGERALWPVARARGRACCTCCQSWPKPPD